jgi:hypothetical protein
MCDGLLALRDAMSRYTAGFDAALLSGAQAEQAVDAAGVIERLAAAVKSMAAVRAADAGAWKRAGERSPAHHLARATGSSVGQAADIIDTARRLEKLPEVAAAARSGELSAQQASAIADAATADPASEHKLVETAKSASLVELREECARTKAASAPDLEARRNVIHARRFLRSYTDSDGAWNLRVRNNPEVGAQVMAALEPVRDRLFAVARTEGRREPSEAYAADALVEAVCGPEGENGGATPSRARPKVIVRVDLPTLLRGYAVDGETCEIAGFGPVAVSAIRDMIDCGNPFLAAVVTKGEAVVGVAHLGRRPTAAQQTALQWLYPTCAVRGCSAVTRLEMDHRVDWARTQLTVLDLLDRLCQHHHDLKTWENWALVEGRGKRAFVPPHDRRHPRGAKTRPRPPDAAAVRILFVSRAVCWRAERARGLGPRVAMGPGVTSSEEPAVRVQSRSRWTSESFPTVLPGPPSTDRRQRGAGGTRRR